MDAWSTIAVAFITGVIGLAGPLLSTHLKNKSEEKKQKLQLEHSRLQMVFDEQKASCRKIIDEMYKAVKIVRFNQPSEDPWNPIPEDNFEATKEALTKEFPFIDYKAKKALDLFLEIMKETVLWDWEIDAAGRLCVDKHSIIIHAYDELEYISDHITNFLQYYIYPINDEPLIQLKVALLKACRFISDDRFKDLKFPNQDIIRLYGFQSPMYIVRVAENNLAQFKTEFASFLNFLKTDPLKLRSEYFMSEIADAEKILPNL